MTPSGGEQTRKASSGEGEERSSALAGNAAAIAAVAAAVEGTLGPRGLNSMLVDRHGDVTITNDGSTILQKIEVNHPAARLLIATARAQDEQVGDGTTTATILAAALVGEGVKQVQRGVPVTRVIEGMKVGLAAALQALREAARPVTLDDPLLRQAALVAGRGEEDLADLVLQAARQIPARQAPARPGVPPRRAPDGHRGRRQRGARRPHHRQAAHEQADAAGGGAGADPAAG